jgi:hypothetical protein
MNRKDYDIHSKAHCSLIEVRKMEVHQWLVT